MSTKWTDEQIHAIYDKPNILVSAAAGSGKTAVLVERIINKLIPDENGIFTNITNLLVVTFARDAAGEMQERIRKKLTELMRETDDSEMKRHFLRQLKLVGQSDITTIDAFCINTVRKNFHLLDIDPSFRIMDNSEALVLKYELLENLLNKKYEEKNESFLLLNKFYSSVGSDYKIIKMLLDLYEFSRSLPYPDEWLDMCVKKYEEEFTNSEYYKYALEHKNKVAINSLPKLKQIKEDILTLADELGFYDESDYTPELYNINTSVLDLMSFCENIISADFDTVVSMPTPSVPKKSTKKSDEIIYINSFISGAKKIQENLECLKKFFYADTKTQIEITKKQSKVISALVNLSKEFGEELFNKKLEKNMFEFNDLEHLTLKLFNENPVICEEYCAKYEEILMDEYQDTNGLQEAIFSAISKVDNRFMVGDMKQSIYRFRSSDPFIFKAKNKSFEENPDCGTNIPLNYNFRSRNEVLESINDVFCNIMFESTGEINYDNTQRLNCGNTNYAKFIAEDYKSEFHIIEKCDDTSDDEENSNIEALYVAKKINELIKDEYKVFDNGELRPIKCSDIAILASSTKNIKNDYISALSKYGIEAAVQSDGFLERTEIRLVCCIISIICNPIQDIPLISVMRSPIFGFSDDELAKIRTASAGMFYDAVKAYASNDEKAFKFLEKLNEWREQAKYLSSNKMLWNIYTDTGLYDIAPLVYDSDSQANLRLMTDMAKTYEGTGYKGLYCFSSYIDMLRANDVNIDSASESKSDDSVHLMTIHKSKGLEFPVVFIVNANKRFSSSPLSIVLHKDLGISLPYSDYESRKIADTIQSMVIGAVKENEETAESMRKLYVAMTRAKEKLYVIASTSAPKSSNVSKKGIAALKTHWSNFSFSISDILSVNNFADWIAPCAIKCKNTWEFKEIIEDSEEDIKIVSLEKEYTDYITYESINELLSRKYQYKNTSDAPSRLYVTQLKNLNSDIMISLKKEPSFLSEKSIEGSAVGNAYHMALSKINPNATDSTQNISEELNIMHQSGYLTESELNYIKPEKIQKLFSSDIGQKMCKTAKLNRETSFEIMVPANEIIEGSDGEVLVQGIIDCWFFDENDDIILIDYKSDYVSEISELSEKYKTQIKWYRYALEKLFKKPVSKSYIYSISKDDWLEIKNEKI